MHFNMATVLVIMTLCAAIYLLLNKSDRMWPTVAVIAAGIQTAVVFGVMTLTLAKFRIDVILPAVLVVCGIMCWLKESTKGTITAATLITLDRRCRAARRVAYPQLDDALVAAAPARRVHERQFGARRRAAALAARASYGCGLEARVGDPVG